MFLLIYTTELVFKLDLGSRLILLLTTTTTTPRLGTCGVVATSFLGVVKSVAISEMTKKREDGTQKRSLFL